MHNDDADIDYINEWRIYSGDKAKLGKGYGYITEERCCNYHKYFIFYISYDFLYK